MGDLIEALQIFLKYDNPSYPTHCEHDEMYICGDYEEMSQEDRDKVESLGFFWSEEDDCYQSFKFGSA